ncbi:MAG TPA: TetR family transcriptional regulator [Phenylobacterium sp.]|nr:TetR family transcriptional regulator [Phenylobacterium sp.]
MTPAAVAKPSKTRARYAAKREAILAAAVDVFHESGVSGFTLAAVAKRMDLHPVSLTYYFKKKEDLAAAVLFDTIHRWEDMLESAEALATPQARLTRFVEAYFEMRRKVAEGEALRLTPFSEIRLIEGEQQGPLNDAFDSLYVRIGRLMKSDHMPWVTAPRRQALARLVVNLLGWTDTWIEAYEASDYPRVAARIAEVMVGGVAAVGQPWPQAPLLTLGPPVAQNDEVTRESFLNAATDLINSSGYRGASVDKISARLKVTKGSFYHHNADKDELAVACFMRSFELIDEAKRRAMAADSGWERLWLAVSSLAMHQVSGVGGRMLRHYALAAVPSSMHHDMVVRFHQIAHSFAGLISDGVADGSLKPVDALLAAHVLMVGFNAAMSMDPRGRPGDTARVMEDYVRPMLLGFFVE